MPYGQSAKLGGEKSPPPVPEIASLRKRCIRSASSPDALTSEYGLTAGIMTEDEQRGLAVAASLDTGDSHINCSPVNVAPHVPFGGFKAAGSGKHGGRWSLETFTETRWVTMERGGRHFPPVF